MVDVRRLVGEFPVGRRVYVRWGRPDNLSITIQPSVLPQDFQKQLKSGVAGLEPASLDQSDFVKFQECLPAHLLSAMQATRLGDPQAVEATTAAKRVFRDVE